MAGDKSVNQYLDNAVKHYSSLFMLPSYNHIIFLSLVICLVAGLSYSLVFSRSYSWPISGVLLSCGLFIATVISNYFLASVVLRNDPVYNLRRIAALSLFCWVLWLIFVFLGCVVAVFSGVIWAVRFCLIGFSAVLVLRFIVLYVTSFSGVKRFLASSIFPPFFCLVLFTLLWFNLIDICKVSFFIACSLSVAFASSFLFIILLNNVGKRLVEISSLSIFKAFLLNWIADLNGPLEVFLEKLGEERDIKVQILRFEGSNNKAFMIVPSIHPGPFKNVGSSLLPSKLKTALEKKFNGTACVLLGLLGHELDLASQNHNQRIIDYVVNSADFEPNEKRATPFVRVGNGVASACCQIFGETALITFSLAPNTTEDLPQELGLIIQREAEKRGLRSCVFVNAHNSLDGAVKPEHAFEALRNVAVSCLEKAASMVKLPFRIGAATVNPADFGLSEGMGHGGITTVIVEVGRQKAAYVVFDGNNMVSGLREKIISALHSIGIDESEVFTTDTHSVNAVTLNARGYHPIGEVMNHERIIAYVTETVCSALSSLVKAKAGFREVKVLKMKVIGEEALKKLCALPDKVLSLAKFVVVPLFAFSFTILMLVLLLV